MVAGLLAVLLARCEEGEQRWPQFTDVGAGLTGVKSCFLAWGDYDNDGDLDLAVAGQGDGRRVCAVYRNDGGVFADIGAGLTGVERCSLAWGDYDGDGDLDLAVSGATSSSERLARVYQNDGGTFTDAGAGLKGVNRCSLSWGDYDNDGDLDLALAGEWIEDVFFRYDTKIYGNDGGTFADVGAALTAVGHCSLAWGDYENDGDLDLALAGYTGSEDISEVYCNSSGAFAEIGAGLTGVAGYPSLAWGDYDNDGDLDLALAGGSGDAGDIVREVYRNGGSGSFVDIGAGLASGGSSSSLAWGDYDNDGDLDLAVAASSTTVYRNDDGSFVDIGAGLTYVGFGSLAWGDYDNDGDLDLALAGAVGSISVTKIYRNNSAARNTPPITPTGLSATIGSGTATFTWNGATDAETPALGLTYNLRVGTDTTKDDVMPGMSIIGGPNDGRRLIPAMGNVQHNTSWTLKGLSPGDYYWSVQAVDTAFAGSPWALEETFTVP